MHLIHAPCNQCDDGAREVIARGEAPEERYCIGHKWRSRKIFSLTWHLVEIRIA
jgi:hypothetical protein